MKLKKNFQKNLNFSFTLRYLYDIIVLVNQQELTLSNLKILIDKDDHFSSIEALISRLTNLKNFQKSLTFSFTLCKLYDIIVLVNQQKLTFDYIMKQHVSNEFKRIYYLLTLI